MRASTGIVFVELLVAMVGLRSIAEARTKARAGFLRVGSRAKVSDKGGESHNCFMSDVCVWKVRALRCRISACYYLFIIEIELWGEAASHSVKE